MVAVTACANRETRLFNQNVRPDSPGGDSVDEARFEQQVLMRFSDFYPNDPALLVDRDWRFYVDVHGAGVECLARRFAKDFGELRHPPRKMP